MAKTYEEYTRRQLDFFTNWSKTGFARDKKKECAIAAGYSPKTPVQSIVNQFEEKIKREMVRLGGTPRALAAKHLQKLDCKHPAHPEQDDNSNQIKALDMAYQMFGVYPAQKIDINKHEESVKLDMVTVQLIKEETGEDITIPCQVIDADTGNGADGTL